MLDFFKYDFMMRALLAGLMISLIAPLLGSFLVARRSSLLTDTLSHSALAGVGLAYLLGFSPLIGALGISIVASVGIEKIITRGKLGPEAVHALFLSGGLAVAVILVSFSSTPVSFENYLFGSIATVSQHDLWLLGGLTVLVSGFVSILWWPLIALSLHEELAEASGVKTGLLKVALTILIALTVSLSLKIVGGLLIGALIVVPVISAMQIGKSFKSTLILAIAFAEGSTVIGLLISNAWDVPSGAAIVLISALGFLLALAAKTTKA